MKDKMSRAEALAQIRLFIEKSDRLRNSKFLETLASKGTSSTVTIDRSKSPQVSATFSGPDRDEVDAFVLTFRFFLQDKDAGIRSTLAALSIVDVGGARVERFRAARDELLKFLDTTIGISINGSVPTFRHVVDTVVYGELAHADPKYSDEARLWLRMPFIAGAVWGEFMHALGVYFTVIRFLADVLRSALCDHSKGTSQAD